MIIDELITIILLWSIYAIIIYSERHEIYISIEKIKEYCNFLNILVL